MPAPAHPNVIRLRPPGRGAAATLLVEGPGAAAAVASRLRAGSGKPPGILGKASGTSALRGDGVQTLVSAIAQRLVPSPPPAGAAVPFAEEQIQALELAASALADNNADRAISILEGV